MILLAFFYCIFSYGQDTDESIARIYNYVVSADNFIQNLPQEKVYIHFDNTNYRKGDDIWFKCYVVNPIMNKPTLLSETLYVELLNTGGEIIDKKVLKIEDGQCHGNFTLKFPVFYGGFYEVRAYTRYMLNYGEDIIFSRVFPVYDISKDGEIRSMESTNYLFKNRPSNRPKFNKRNKLNIDFYPEGGSLVSGLKSKVAFRATDQNGNAISIEGVVYNSQKKELSWFSSGHSGMGEFIYMPDNGEAIAEVKHEGNIYNIKLPEPVKEGAVLTVDNTSMADSVLIKVNKSLVISSEMTGVAVLSGGKVYKMVICDIQEKDILFTLPKKILPSGVSHIVLFNEDGRIMADRLIFINHQDYVQIKFNTNKNFYEPYEKIEVDFKLNDKDNKPLKTDFSLAVRDGADSVVYKDNIITNILLSSEIKGYIEDPMYYFESTDEERLKELDVLMMVQGWRRYSWHQLAGIDTFEMKHAIEKGIPIKGTIRSLVKKVPKENVDVSLFLKPDKNQIEEDDEGAFAFSETKTDSLGIFMANADLIGDWGLVIQIKEKGKIKNYDILLDRLFSPDPKAYTYQDIKIDYLVNSNLSEYTEMDNILAKDTVPETNDMYNVLDNIENIEMEYHLKEVEIKGRRNTNREQNLAKSTLFYDMPSVMDDIIDEGGLVTDVREFLDIVNKDFRKMGNDFTYKGKAVLFVINDRLDSLYRYDIADIKSIYVSDAESRLIKYAPVASDPAERGTVVSKKSRKIGAVVFIETYQDDLARRKAKGVRNTTLKGYSLTKEFYSPDYDILLKEPDYRRTLYWNPSVYTDENGNAKVSFFNNSITRHLKIDAETITQDGILASSIAF